MIHIARDDFQWAETLSLCSVGEELLAVQVSALWPESTWRRLLEVTRDFPRSEHCSHETTDPV
jgi:hypothetical protein